jgi:hypothetical protein
MVEIILGKLVDSNTNTVKDTLFYGESKPFLKTGIKIRIRVKSNVMLLFQAFTVLIGDPLWSILWRKHYEIFVHPFCLS